MSESKLESKPEDLIQAEQLVVEGKFEDAYELMNKFLERGESTHKDSLLCNLIKVRIMNQQGLYEDAIKLASQTYKESLELKDILLTFDALDLEIQTQLHLIKLEELLEKIEDGERLLKILPKDLPKEYKKRRAALEFLKSWFYYYKNDKREIMKHYELCLALYEEIGDNEKLATVLLASTMYFGLLKGEFNLAKNNTEKGLEISKNKNWKYGIAFGLLTKGIICSLQGDVENSTINHEQSLVLFEELNNKDYVAHIHNNLSWNYMIMGDLEKALKSIEISMKYRKEQGKLKVLAFTYDNLITILVEKGDLEKAQKAIEELEILKNQLNSKQINLQYLYDKALVLKTSPRSRNRIEAEDIFKQIIEDDSISYEMLINSLLNLCNLLLTELNMTNDLSVLEEIDTFIIQLLEIAEKGHSFILFTEIYFLKAKLALLTFDLKTARRFLIQAQRIAERFGYSQLAVKISQEHEKLREQLNIWHNLREKEISLSERMKLAGMDEQMKHLLQNRAILTSQVKEQQITIHKERKVCIVCKGDILGFMYSCNCDALYCEKCARVLTEIENACWVCGTPIDITKPIKPFKQEELGDKEIIKGKNKE